MHKRKKLLPSGTQSIINNRVGWAKFYLERAGLVNTVSRGVYQISQEGLQLLQSDRKKINVAFLKTLTKFRDWYAENVAGGNKGNKNDSEDDSDTSIETSKTPDELINEAFKRINEELAFEVLDKVNWSPPQNSRTLL
ncbi:MAG: winged helix-turn-helix domain-containing protein [Fulvivirga sp.]